MTLSAPAHGLVKLIREIADDAVRSVEQWFQDGVVDSVEGAYASVRLGANDSATPSFYIPPGLAVAVGDHVLVYRRDGYQVITDVLNRNAFAGNDKPDTVAGTADYLARIKLRTDEHYRLVLGLDGSDRASLAAGPGSGPLDATITRTTTGEWTIADALALGGANARAMLRLRAEREWRLEQRAGTSGGTAEVQLRPTSANASFHVAANAGAVLATFRDEAGAARLSFYGATPVARATVTGSRGGNAALASLLTALAALGLIIDNTSA